VVLVNQGASSVPSEEEELRKEHLLILKIREAKRRIVEAARRAKQSIKRREPGTVYAEKQLRRAKAVEERLEGKQLTVVEQHWKQENIVEPLPVTEKHPEVVQQYEKAVLTPAIGWEMIRARLEKEALKAKREAKVEKTEVKLPPHLIEELGMETVPSYKPNKAAVKAYTSSLAASGASFTQGFLEGLAVPLLPHRIAEGTAQLVKNPAGVLKKQAALIAANPLEASRLTGQLAGSYLAFKAIGKGIEKITTRKVSYELVPEKTEKKFMEIIGEGGKREAVFIEKVEGYPVKAKVSGVPRETVFSLKEPGREALKIALSGKGKRITVLHAAKGSEVFSYASYDLIKRVPVDVQKIGYDILVRFGRKKWFSFEAYRFSGPKTLSAVYSNIDDLFKDWVPKLAMSERASLKMFETGTPLTLKTSASILQKAVAKTSLIEPARKTVTILEPLVPAKNIGLLGPAATVLTKTRSETRKTLVPKEPKPVLGSKPKAGTGLLKTKHTKTHVESPSKTSTFSLEKEFEDIFKLKRFRAEKLLKEQPLLKLKTELELKLEPKLKLKLKPKTPSRTKTSQTPSEILKTTTRTTTIYPPPPPLKPPTIKILPLPLKKKWKQGKKTPGKIRHWRRIWAGKLNILNLKKKRSKRKRRR